MNQRKFDKLSEMALPYALDSSRKKKHVSLILVRNNIISVGTNQLKSHPKAKKIGYRYDEVHSELDAVPSLQDYMLFDKEDRGGGFGSTGVK